MFDITSLQFQQKLDIFLNGLSFARRFGHLKKIHSMRNKNNLEKVYICSEFNYQVCRIITNMNEEKYVFFVSARKSSSNSESNIRYMIDVLTIGDYYIVTQFSQNFIIDSTIVHICGERVKMLKISN